MRPILGVIAGLSLLASACAQETTTPDTVGTPEPVDTPAALSWEEGAELPTPRTEIAVAALEGRIYAAGGFTADGSTSDVVEVYDPEADAWESSVALPVGLHHMGLASARGRLYAVGGYRADRTASDGVWSWAPGEESWRPEPPMPTARGALAVAAVEVADAVGIHAVGGATGFGADTRLSEAHEVLVLARGEWQTLPALPGPRDHLAAASEGGRLVVVGGRELSLARNLPRVDVFDPLESRWTRGADLPTARGGLAAAAVGGRVYVFGGEEPAGTFEEAEMYDVDGDGWSTAPAMPTARHGLGAAVDGARVYVVGGGPTPGLSVSGANEILVVDAPRE